jgi:Ca2+-binding EF-hand superfamily protein
MESEMGMSPLRSSEEEESEQDYSGEEAEDHSGSEEHTGSETASEDGDWSHSDEDEHEEHTDSDEDEVQQQHEDVDIRAECATCLTAVHQHHVLSDEPYEEWLERNHIPDSIRRQLAEQDDWVAAQIDAVQDAGMASFMGHDPTEGTEQTSGDGTQFHSLGLLSMEWRLRRNAVWLASHPLFGGVFTFLVVLSVASLTLDTANNTPGEKDWVFPATWVDAPGVGGCTHGRALNTNKEKLDLTYDDGTCLFGGIGCMDTRASNFDFCATHNDQASCVFAAYGGDCMVSTKAKRMGRGKCAGNNGRGSEPVRDGVLPTTRPDGSTTICHMHDSRHLGCMNPHAHNFDRLATSEVPGSCGYCSVRWSVINATITRQECAHLGRISFSVLQQELDWWLLLAFTFEAGLKVVAFGLARGPNTYLKLGWNLLDLWVILTAWVPYMLGLDGSGSVWRTFRLLRPLRTIQRFSGLRRLVEALLMAIPQLGSLISLLLMFFTVYSVVGVQLWSGRWKQRCFDQDGLVTMAHCDIDQGSPEDAGCAVTDTCGYAESNPFETTNPNAPPMDFVSFDSVLSALMIVLHLATLSSWSEMMQVTQETSGWISFVYFVSAAILGGYLMMTLFVCILKENFDAAIAVKAEGAAAFLKIDLDGSGELDLAEVGRVFLTHGLYLTDEQVNSVFAVMDTDGSGTVGVEEFMAFLAGNSDVAVKLRKKMGVDGVEDDGEDDDALDPDAMLDSIKHKLTQLASLRHDAAIDWKILFDYYDTDGNSELDLREFKSALRRDAHVSMKHMSDEDIADLFAEIDTDGGGTIDLAEFDAWMQEGVDKLPPIEEQTKVAVEDALVKIAVRELHIQRRGEMDPATQVEKAIRKAGAPELIQDFALSDFGREIYINYQPKLTQRMPGGFRSETYGGHGGPRLVTVTSKLIEPLVGHAIRFQCSENLVQVVGECTQRPVDAICSTISYYECVSLSSIRTTIRTHLIFKPFFSYFFLACIVANVAVMCINYHGISSELERKVDLANHAFTVVFAVELLLKAAGQTTREFWHHGVSSGINCFEVVIVGCGLLELLQFLGDQQAQDFAIFSLARFFRVLRAFRLVTVVPKMRQVVDVLISTSYDLIFVCMLILMVLFIYTMLGMQLFGGKLTGDDGINPPRGHWDTPMIAFLTTFQIMTLDGWSKVLEDTVSQMGMGYVMYFVSWIFIGSFVLMKMLLVIILEAYAVTQAKVNLKNAAYQKELGKSNKSKATLDLGMSQGLLSGSGDFNNPLEKNTPMTRTLSKFTSEEAAQASGRVDDAMRHKARKFITSEVTQKMYVVFIILSCVVVALDKPWLNAAGVARSFADAMALLFYLVFGFEVFCFVYGFGFIEKPTSYLNAKNPMVYYNRLDFFIFVTSTFDVLVAIDGPASRYFRLLRAFRALRLLSKSRGLRKVIESVVKSMASLWSVICVMLVCWLMFSLAAVHVFKGALYSCTDSSEFVFGRDSCAGSFLHSDGSVAGRTWHQPPVHYDDVPAAMYSLFETAISQEWIEHAIDVMDSTVVGVQPMREANSHWGYFFAIFIILNRVFLLNLCTACVYTKYLEVKQKGLEQLTNHQKDWLTIMRSLPMVTPQKSHGDFGKTKSHKIFEIVTDKRFEHGVSVIVVVNIFGMAMHYDGEPAGWKLAQDIINFTCTGLFTAEMVAKILAFDVRGYFAESYNRFEAIVVVASWMEVLIVALSLEHVVPSVMFRLIRIVRVVGRVGFLLHATQKQRSMKHIADTFTTSLSALGHVLFLVAIILYVFGVIAMNEFGNVVIQNCLTDYRNFQTTPRAALTLFGVATGDDFSCIVHSVMIVEDLGDPDGCRNNPGSDLSQVGTCGGPITARVFFVAFQFCIQLTVIHLFVNVVLAKFEELTQLNALAVTKAELDAFVDAWKVIDNNAEGKMPVSRVPELLAALPRALGFDRLAGEEAIRLHELRLPERDDGRLSRFVVAGEEPMQMIKGASQDGGQKTAHKVRDTSYPYVPPDVALKDVEGEEVGFYEILYGLCERKAGTPLPNNNKAVRLARLKLARRMPTIKDVHNSKKWVQRPGNPARWAVRGPSVDEENPAGMDVDAIRDTMRIGSSTDTFGVEDGHSSSDDDAGPAMFTFDVEESSAARGSSRQKQAKPKLSKEEKDRAKLQKKADQQRAREDKAAAKRAAKREKVSFRTEQISAAGCSSHWHRRSPPRSHPNHLYIYLQSLPARLILTSCTDHANGARRAEFCKSQWGWRGWATRDGCFRHGRGAEAIGSSCLRAGVKQR